MDFARKQLEKYGWSEGRGLGKNEDGISSALRPQRKVDQAGLGHDPGRDFTNKWWEKLFDEAAGNIKVDSTGEDVQIKSTRPFKVATDASTSRHPNLKAFIHSGSFTKTSTKLTGNTVVTFSDSGSMEQAGYSKSLTDEELFAACSNRTTHKGARHGIRQNGKLSRIEKQEKMLLKKMRKVSLSDNEKDEKDSVEKKLKKLKKQKSDNIKEKYVNIQKKAKKKSVSFNETVTTIYTPDLDTSVESEITSKDENSNSSNQENIGSGSDEGIEQDFQNNNNNNNNNIDFLDLDHHQSFEMAQFKISDLSKAEKKKLKKKRKLETVTATFLQKLFDEEEQTTDVDDKDKNLKKRKFLEDAEQENRKRGHIVTSPLQDKCKSKRNEKKTKKQKRLEKKQFNFIIKSFDGICQINND